MSRKQEEALNESLMDPATRVKELARRGAESAKVDRSTSIKYYYRSAPQMKKQAQIYYDEGNLESAFILDNKFLTLFVEKLKTHPQFAKASPEDKKQIKPLVKSSIERATELKGKLLRKYEEEKQECIKAEEEEAKKRDEEEARRRNEEEVMRRAGEEAIARARDEAVRSMEEEAARRELEAKRSGQSIREGDTVARDRTDELLHANTIDTLATGDFVGPTMTSSIPADLVPDTRAGGMSFAGQPVVTSMAGWGSETTTEPRPFSYIPPAAAHDSASAPPPLSYQKSVCQSSVDTTSEQDPWTSGSSPSFVMSGSMTSGPVPVSVPSYTSPWSQATAPPYSPQPPQNTALYQFPPSIISAPPTYTHSQGGSMWGPLPLPTGAYNPEAAARPVTAPPTSSPRYLQGVESVSHFEDRPSTAVPAFDRSLKPVSAITTSLGGYGGYRPVYVPADTASRFEQAAAENTLKNTETCGILAGKLSKNELRITHIIIPKQRGSSDSCEMNSEEEMFDVQDKYDVITLGWIHTHPTQTAFLSSVDLHTQYSYQVMMDEALAIVCAPKYKNVGMFTLTNPYGLDVIARCEQGGFHRHPTDPPLFEECSHVIVDEEAAIEIVDLRC